MSGLASHIRRQAAAFVSEHPRHRTGQIEFEEGGACIESGRYADAVMVVEDPIQRGMFVDSHQEMGAHGCAQELDIVGAMPLCIRVMMHLSTELGRDELRHVYLEQARSLRDDLPE